MDLSKAIKVLKDKRIKLEVNNKYYDIYEVSHCEDMKLKQAIEIILEEYEKARELLLEIDLVLKKVKHRIERILEDA